MGRHNTGTVPEVKQSGRLLYLDILRILAAFFVICVHTVSLASSLLDTQGTSFYVLEILRFVTLSCNPLFVMVSGALLLTAHHEPALTFYRKRFTKVLVPFIVYYIMYLCAKEGIIWIYPVYWGVLIKRIFLGAPSFAPHFWLVYVLIWLYIFTPLLRFVISHISKQLLYILAFVLFLFNLAYTLGNYYGISLPFGVIVDSFLVVFLLGYILHDGPGARAERVIIVLGIISLIISVITIFYLPDYGDYIFNTSPFMILCASAVFLIVKKIFGNKNNVSNFLVALSNISYQVLLIHWGVLHFCVKQILHVNVLSGGIVGGCLLMITLTCAISIAGAAVIDKTIIKLINYIFGGKK